MSVNTFPLEVFDFGVSLSGIIYIKEGNLDLHFLPDACKKLIDFRSVAFVWQIRVRPF